MSFRKYKTIDSLAFDRTLITSDLISKPKGNLDELVDQYNATLRYSLDTHAPLQKNKVTIKRSVPWYNDNIRAEKIKEATM